MLNNQIIWKDIYLSGIKSDYMISNTGKILNRETNELRIPSLTKNGYLRLILYCHGLSYPVSIHRLVAEYFVINSDPKNNIQVDHKDGNKQNNNDWNLEWVTPKENTNRAIKLGLTDPKKRNQVNGSKSGVSKFTEDQVNEVCKLLEKGLSNKEISELINVDSELVRNIRRKKSWTHISSQYIIPEPEKRNYYNNEFRDNIKILISCGRSDIEIAHALGMSDPESYGKKYVNKIRSRINKDQSSTTIPWIIYDFKYR